MATKTATVDSASVAATLSNYPTYIDLSRVGITTQAEADSVRIYTDSSLTTEIAREIVSVSECHAKIPSLTTTTQIWIDNDGERPDYGVTDTYGRNAVWSDYLLVAHMNEDPSTGGTPVVNSTGGTAGSTLGGMTSGDLVTGLVEDGLEFDGVNDEIRYSDTDFQNFTHSQDVTFSLFVKTSTAAQRNLWENRLSSTIPFWTAAIDSNGRPGVFNRVSSNRRSYSIWDVTANDNAWHYIVFTRDGSLNGTSAAQKLYFDGVAASLFSHTTDAAGTGSFGSGNVLRVSNGLNGPLASTMDEFRIREWAASADWATTETNNLTDEATFWGTWTDAGGGGATFIPKILSS